MDDSLRPLSPVVEDESEVEVRDTSGLTVVYCPECEVMVRVERVAVEPVPGEDHVRHVGYDVSCDHDFAPDDMFTNNVTEEQ